MHPERKDGPMDGGTLWTPEGEHEIVDAEVVASEAESAPELREAVEDAMSVESYTAEAGDEHGQMIAMDAHDAARFVERLVRQAQESNLGKRWVYSLPG